MSDRLFFRSVLPGIIFCILLLFNSNVFALADVTLAWDPPALNTDGSDFVPDSGDEYIIYYGTEPDTYSPQGINVGNSTTGVVPGLTEGVTYYFSVTITQSGNESGLADEISYYINIPAAGTDITVNDSVSPVNDLQIPFGNITVGSTSNQTVTVTNDGDEDLLVGSIAQSNPLAAPFSIINDNCSGQTVSVLSSCTLTVRFSPAGTAVFSDSFDIPSNDSDENPVTVSVSGTGQPQPVPDITVSDSVSPGDNQQIPFGNITEGSTSSQTVTVTNDGNTGLAIGSIAQSNPLAVPFSIVNDNCSGQTINTSSNCTLTVRFSPSAAGAFNDSFDIPSNDSDENPVTVSVSGTGQAQTLPDITVTDSVAPTDNQQITFGGITEGNVSNQTVTVTNNGNSDLVIGSIAQSNTLTAPFSILNDTCSEQSVGPASNCTLTVRFSPSATVAFNDSFDIPSNDSDENPVTVSVSGTGEALPVPDVAVTDSVAPASDQQIPFGDLTEGLTSDKIISIVNNGSADLDIGYIAQSNQIGLPFSISDDNCSGQTLSVSSSCTLTVRFSPDTIGSFNDSFDIPSNDPDEDPVTITVSGTGLSSIVNNPPSVPALIYPANGQEGVGESVDFQWEESIDPDKDPVTYYLYYSEDADFSDDTPVIIASLENNNVHYAGVGSFGTVLIVIALFTFFIAIAKNRKRITVLITILIIAGMLLTSCGEVDDLLGDIIPFLKDVTNGVSRTVTGLVTGGSYCWKVIADDGSGGQSESGTNCFGT
jgi:hypothetical protein